MSNGGLTTFTIICMLFYGFIAVLDKTVVFHQKTALSFIAVVFIVEMVFGILDIVNKRK